MDHTDAKEIIEATRQLMQEEAQRAAKRQECLSEAVKALEAICGSPQGSQAYELRAVANDALLKIAALAVTI